MKKFDNFEEFEDNANPYHEGTLVKIIFKKELYYNRFGGFLKEKTLNKEEVIPVNYIIGRYVGITSHNIDIELVLSDGTASRTNLFSGKTRIPNFEKVIESYEILKLP